MNSQLTQATLKVVIDFLISLKITKSGDKLNKCQRVLEDLQNTGNIRTEKDLSDIFSKLTHIKTT